MLRISDDLRSREALCKLAVLGCVIFWLLVVQSLGFLLTTALVVGVLAVVLGASLLPAAAVAVGLPILLHLVFGTLLRVPLPRGLIGGVIGILLLMFAAPLLAKFATNFSSAEYFWLALLGLSCVAIVSTGSALKGTLSLLFGLFVSFIGIDEVAGQARFTFGSYELNSRWTASAAVSPPYSPASTRPPPTTPTLSARLCSGERQPASTASIRGLRDILPKSVYNMQNTVLTWAVALGSQM